MVETIFKKEFKETECSIHAVFLFKKKRGATSNAVELLCMNNVLITKISWVNQSTCKEQNL